VLKQSLMLLINLVNPGDEFLIRQPSIKQ